MKEFLSRTGKPFVVKLVDQDDAAYDELLARGYRTVPLTVVGEVAVVGFDVAALTRAVAAAG